MIPNITDREVNGVVLMLAGRDGNSCFVASKYDRNKDCSVHINIRGNDILFAKLVNVDTLCKTRLHIASKPSHPT